MNRKDRRAHLQELSFFHTKAFDKKDVQETVLGDWSIEFIVTGYATMTHKDYDGDVIIPQWADLSRIIKNPIVKRGHLRGVENNIGTIIEATIEPDNGIKVITRIVQNPEIPAHKEMIHWLRHWLIMWYSIWFAVKKWGYEDLEGWGLLINDRERHELSVVDIPNNPHTVFEAVTKAIKSLSNDINTMNTKEITTQEEVVEETLETVDEVTAKDDTVEQVDEVSTEELETTVEEEKDLGEDPAEQEIEELEVEEAIEEEKSLDEEAVDESEQEDDLEEKEVEEVLPDDAETATSEKSVTEGVSNKELLAKVATLESEVEELKAAKAKDDELMIQASETIKSLTALVEQAEETYVELGKTRNEKTKQSDGLAKRKVTYGDFRDIN